MHTSIETQLRRCGARHETLTNEMDYATLIKSLHDQRDAYFNQISDYVLVVDDGNIAGHINELKNFFTKEQYTLTPSPGLSEKALVFFKHNTDIPVRLSQQQAICLKHLANGLSAKEIAREMAISHRTVEVYIAQLKKKLACDSSKDLISLYLKN